MKKYNKSKVKIMYAFANLLLDNSLTNINTNLIIENAKVSKGTFYNNFKSISDLIVFTEHYIDDSIQNNLNHSDLTNDEPTIDSFIDCILPAIYEKRELIKVMYKSDIRGIWCKFLEKRYNDWLMKNIFDKSEKNNDLITKDTACKFFIHSFLFLIESWITKPIPESLKNIKPVFFELLSNPVLKTY